MSFAGAHTLSTDDRDWLRRNLVVVFKNSAAAYLDDPSANARCLRMMEQIVDYLPAGTRVDFGGEDATLTEHVEKLRILAPLLSTLKSGGGSGGPPRTPPTTTQKQRKRKAPKRMRSARRRNENVKAGLAYLVAGLLWVAIIAGWSLLVWWVWGLVAGNTILQVTVLVLAVVLQAGRQAHQARSLGACIARRIQDTRASRASVWPLPRPVNSRLGYGARIPRAGSVVDFTVRNACAPLRGGCRSKPRSPWLRQLDDSRHHPLPSSTGRSLRSSRRIEQASSSRPRRHGGVRAHFNHRKEFE